MFSIEVVRYSVPRNAKAILNYNDVLFLLSFSLIMIAPKFLASTFYNDKFMYFFLPLTCSLNVLYLLVIVSN